MPEGDTIAYAANRIRPVLLGHAPDEISTHRRFSLDRWEVKLAGRVVTRIDTHGKHLFIRFGPLARGDAARSPSRLARPGGGRVIPPARQGRADRMSSGRFEGDWVIHSHLGMVGAWRVISPGGRWGRSPRRAWLVMRCGDTQVVEFDGPLLELITDGRARIDQRLAALGPDVLAVEFESQRFLRRLRGDDQTRFIGDALIDQRNVAGLGNIWKAEGCWEAGLDPWRRVSEVSDAEALSVVSGARPRMQLSADRGHRTIKPRVYGRAGRPCPRCGALIVARAQGDANRTTYWCPGCQH